MFLKSRKHFSISFEALTVWQIFIILWGKLELRLLRRYLSYLSFEIVSFRTLNLKFRSPPCIMFVQYTRILAVQWKMFSTLEDIMSTVADIMSTQGGYHDKCEGRSLGKQLKFVWKPQCAEHPPVYSWYPPTVVMVFLQCTHGIPTVLNSLGVFVICPPPPNVLNRPQCIQWYPPSVLNIPWSTAQTLCRVINNLRSCLNSWILDICILCSY